MKNIFLINKFISISPVIMVIGFMITYRLEAPVLAAQKKYNSNICKEGTFAIKNLKGSTTKYVMQGNSNAKEEKEVPVSWALQDAKEKAIEDCKADIVKLDREFYQKEDSNLELNCGIVQPIAQAIGESDKSHYRGYRGAVKILINIAYCCTPRNVHERFYLDLFGGSYLKGSCTKCPDAPKCKSVDASQLWAVTPVKFYNASDSACGGAFQ